jgi:hypothetical protein
MEGRLVTSPEHLFLQRVQYLAKIQQPYFARVQVILESKEQGSRLPDPCHRYYPEVPRLPWVTVSDKSSAADIPRQWPATGLANTVCVEAS